MSLSGLMMHEPPLRVGAAAEYAYSDRLARKFSAVSRYGEPYILYRRAGDRILLPRGVCPAGGAGDQRAAGRDVAFGAARFTPRSEDQARWVARSIAFLAAGQSGISQAFTGFGKSVCAMPVIAALGKKTLIVCTKEDMMLSDDQWYGTLRKFLGLSPAEIGIVRQDRCEVAGKKVVVGLIHSLAIPGRYPAGTFDDIGLVIADECHHVPADTFSNVMFLFRARLRWGLSATPERKDGKDAILHAHIGPVRVRSRELANPPKVLHVRSGWRCPDVPHAPARIAPLLQPMARDEQRNDLIGRIAREALRKRYNVVIFTELLDHVALLRLTLNTLGMAWGDIGIYVGGMTEKEREAAKLKPLVLTTWRMCAEATNAPWWSCAVWATPRADVVQAAGRVMREYPGKPTPPLVVDIADADSPVLAGYARARRAWYRSIGAQQVEL